MAASMPLQVLAIGEIQEGSSNGRDWCRRQFQVFTADQVAGNISVYGEKSELEAFTKLGQYNATVQTVAGNNGRLEVRFTGLELSPKGA